MKKTYRLENLGCANCAAKMETAIRKLAGVNGATIAFMTQRLSLDAEDAMVDEILEQAQAAIRKIEPDCKILR